MVLAAAVLLPLDSAFTVNFVYTFQASYLLMVGAMGIAFPMMVRGWLGAPRVVRWAAVGLTLAYALAFALGQEVHLPGLQRAGSHRDFVFLADLLVGLGSVGLLIGLWRSRSPRNLVTALAVGVAGAAIYASYQWLALRFGGPLTDLNNTRDVYGVSTGLRQGAGLFGWERAHGTFSEPHGLGAFLAMGAPLVAYCAYRASGVRRVLWLLMFAPVAFGLLAANSLPSYMTLVVAVLAGALAAAIGLGRVRVSGVVAAALCAALLTVPVILVLPGSFSRLAGRSSASLQYTTAFRTDAWKAAATSWSARPVIGYGPGQSSVRVALAASSAPRQLASAQGLWAASLIDAGVFGFAAWLILLAAIAAAATGWAVRGPTALRVALLMGGLVAILGSQVADDRLIMRTWFMLGVVLAATCGIAAAEDGDREQQADTRAADGPSGGGGAGRAVDAG